MPCQFNGNWNENQLSDDLTAEQFSGTNIHNILCFSAYATNRFLVHPSIHHKNKWTSIFTKKNTYSFQPRILTDKFIIKKHHCVQIWNFLLVVHLQKLMIHRYSLNSTEPPWLRNTTVHQVACHGGCAFWMTLLERFNYHSIWHCFELISGVGKFSWTGNETSKERLVKPHFWAVKCLVLLQEIPYGWSCSPHFCWIRLAFCCFKTPFIMVPSISNFGGTTIQILGERAAQVEARKPCSAGAERPDGGCTKKAGHMKFEFERIHILSTYGTILMIING